MADRRKRRRFLSPLSLKRLTEAAAAQPFGHSNTEAWLLGAEAGFESLFWGRTDYQDLNYRMSYEGQQNNQWPEWVWRGSQSLGSSAEVFAGQLTTHNYGAPISWDTGKRHDIAAI